MTHLTAQESGDYTLDLHTLSAGAQRVMLLVFALMCAYIVYSVKYDTGVWWLIQAGQMRLFGWVSPKGSCMLVLLTVAIPSIMAAYCYDYLTGQGPYAPKPCDDESAAVSDRELG